MPLNEQTTRVDLFIFYMIANWKLILKCRSETQVQQLV